MSNKMDIQGMGVFCEIYKRDEKLTDVEMLREAAKAITREVIRRECNETKTTKSS